MWLIPIYPVRSYLHEVRAERYRRSGSVWHIPARSLGDYPRRYSTFVQFPRMSGDAFRCLQNQSLGATVSAITIKYACDLLGCCGWGWRMGVSREHWLWVSHVQSHLGQVFNPSAMHLFLYLHFLTPIQTLTLPLTVRNECLNCRNLTFIHLPPDKRWILKSNRVKLWDLAVLFN